MTRYVDAFGRETFIEISTYVWTDRIGFVIKKERQSVAESIDINTAQSIVCDLQEAIETVIKNKEKK